MSRAPVPKGMNSKTGRYFERAEFESDFPAQFIILVIGLFLVVFEGSLGLWGVFYGATPLLSMIFLFWIALYFEKLMPIGTAFAMGIVSDVLFSDLLGGRALAFMLVLYAMQYWRFRLQQSDFMEVWTNFSVATSAVLLFQFIIFSVINFAIPSTTPILFQLGLTLILFPIGYVMMSAVSTLVRRVGPS